MHVWLNKLATSIQALGCVDVVTTISKKCVPISGPVITSLLLLGVIKKGGVATHRHLTWHVIALGMAMPGRVAPQAKE